LARLGFSIAAHGVRVQALGLGLVQPSAFVDDIGTSISRSALNNLTPRGYLVCCDFSLSLKMKGQNIQIEIEN
jgi:hypothetical protein